MHEIKHINTSHFTMSTSDNSTLTRAEIRSLEQRKIRWNGKNKFGSYGAYDDVIRARKFQRDQQRAAIKRAEENGEFIPVKSSGVITVQTEAPKKDYCVRRGGFAALADHDDSSDEDDDEDTVSHVPVSGVQELLTKERDDAEAVTTTLGGNNTREANLTKPTWFEMCESDEEE